MRAVICPSPSSGWPTKKPESLADDCALAKVVVSAAVTPNCKGPAVVIDFAQKFSRTQPFVATADLEHARSQIAETRRVLLKTNCFPDSRRFPDWIPVLKPEAITWLRELRVVLLGVDLPSVDPIEAKVLANHYALTAGNIAIVESLDLSEIEAGVYQFAALPLKVVGGDAAPVRALLWRD